MDVVDEATAWLWPKQTDASDIQTPALTDTPIMDEEIESILHIAREVSGHWLFALTEMLVC